MSKRKRVVYYDDTEPASKKLKLLSEEDKETFLEEKRYQTFHPVKFEFEERKYGEISEEEDQIILFRDNKMKVMEEQFQFQKYFMKNQDEYNTLVPRPPKVSPEKEEKTKGFSAVNRKMDILELLGEDICDLKKWRFDYLETYPGSYDEYSAEADKEFNQKHEHLVMKEERSQESYIEVVVTKVCAMVSSTERKECLYIPQGVVTRFEHAGPVDFVIRYDSVKVVIIEAKRRDIEEGARQLIMELKALQEEQGMTDKWYCGFSALGRTWKPLRLNMNKDGRERVEVGDDILIPKGEDQKKYLKRVMYILSQMILEKFKKYGEYWCNL